ncbi:cation:proton antiporter [Candidatus Manganitrophus noduliformans]|uniref:Sodium:proton antiporter n=1 Tax=Candidatus Manganitrophus noduliformans TaxID=2606439 RepID=A0A7X6DPD4_9BACT|nr:sodium:proton antiporter [Candidatus Manganitrophus noduliformans]NKE70847.1 sodium:proton antiporter [Candidatus Manganitrophus noduliformans]
MDTAHIGLIIAVALAAGVFAQSVSRHLRIPGIVLLLALGVLLGPEALNWVKPRALGAGLFGIVDFAVAIILFEGGLNLVFSRLRREELPIRRLITWGALVSLIGGTVAVRALLGWSWDLAFLFGSLVVVTGPTVVTPLVREMRLRPKIKTILEAEGVLIDPIGVILAVLVFDIVLTPEAKTVMSGLATTLLRLGFGVLSGMAGGFLIGRLLRFRRVVPHGHENIFALASAVLIFHGCDHVVPHSGIFAVTIAGVVVGNSQIPVDRDLREFKDQLTVLLVGLLFILLSADIRLEDVRGLGWQGLGVLGALIFAVRPLGVWFSTRGSNLSLQERFFISWVAPRGIVAAALATLTAATMESNGMPGSTGLRALVFLTIAGTVLLAGFTARPVATLLGLRLPGRDRVAILGAHGLGLVLGAELRDAGLPVVFLDSDPKFCRQAEEAGFPVVFGNALEERTLLRAQFELVGVAVGVTSNEHLNSMFVGQANEFFEVPKGYVAVDALEGGKTPEYVQRQGAEVLFDGPHETERWDVRFRHKDAVVERLVFRPSREAEDLAAAAKSALSKNGERFVILATRRGEKIFPMSLSYTPRDGDIASVALYIPEREAALRLLGEWGWEKSETKVEPTPSTV